MPPQEETRPLIPNAVSEKSVGGGWIQARHVLAIMAFFGFVNVYCLRVNLSIALVAMSNTSEPQNNMSAETQCKYPYNNTTPQQNSGEFPWGENTQGLILSMFFYGYLVTQVPGGYLAERYGGKYLFGLGVLSTAVLNLLTPVVARWNLYALYALRIIEGLGEGVTFPAVHAMWGNWAPIWERTLLASFTYAGAQFGTVISMPISGLLCSSTFLGGWPSVFYVFGVIACIWVIAWFLIIHETPADHPTISKSEREYIENSIGKREKMKVPWKKILTCGGLWGMAVASIANAFGIYTFLACLPVFMKRILKFDIQSNGLLCALPYFVMMIVQISSAYMADHIRTRNYLSTQNTRRLMSIIGLVIPAGLLVGVTYVGCDHVWAVTLLTLSLGISGFCNGGFGVNHLDIAPKFAGILMGITNGLGTIPGFLAPIIVDAITGKNETVESWRIVFFLTAGIYVFGAVVFIILARGDEMPWAREHPKSEGPFVGSTSIQREREDFDVNVPPPHLPPPLPPYQET